jgi:hypothetical protein
MISFRLLSAFPTWHRLRFSSRTTDSHSGHVSIDRRAGLRVFSDLATATPLLLSQCKQFCWNDKESPKTMQTKRKTMIVTGAAKGIGAGVTNAFIERGHNVVANSLNITVSTLAVTDRLAVVRGDIGDPSDRVPDDTWQRTKSCWKVYPRCQSPDIRHLDSAARPYERSR